MRRPARDLVSAVSGGLYLIEAPPHSVMPVPSLLTLRRTPVCTELNHASSAQRSITRTASWILVIPILAGFRDFLSGAL